MARVVQGGGGGNLALPVVGNVYQLVGPSQPSPGMTGVQLAWWWLVQLYTQAKPRQWGHLHWIEGLTIHSRV